MYNIADNYNMNKTQHIRRVYRWLNEEYFDGILPEVQFDFVEDATFGGMAWNSEPFFTIIFSTAFHYDYVEILLHEMCHIYQFVTDFGKKDHGKEFKQIALDISQRSGYNIRKYQDMEWK
jgi:predicted SprT family Zn-dependent metalloprotease